jgi:hypothetical protein
MTQITLTATSLQKKFTDLDFGFALNPGTGDVGKKVNTEAVKQSMRNLILTKKYERPFNPHLSCQIYDLLFELFTPNIKSTIERVIFDVIDTYEPRVQLLDVEVNPTPDHNSLDITLVYQIVGIELPSEFTFTLERTR